MPFNDNTPFLLLDLDVGVAVALVSELIRHSTLNPSLKLAERC